MSDREVSTIKSNWSKILNLKFQKPNRIYRIDGHGKEKEKPFKKILLSFYLKRVDSR